MTLRRLPLLSWMIFVNSFLVILALPVLNAALVMLLIDRLLRPISSSVHGGSAIMWQHIFWAFGHPEVYIVALPAFGMMSEVIPVFSRKPIFGYEFVAGSTVAIAFLSLGVWAHHMFTTGLGHTIDLFFVRFQQQRRHPDRSESLELKRHHDRRPSPLRYADALLRGGAPAIPGRWPNGLGVPESLDEKHRDSSRKSAGFLGIAQEYGWARGSGEWNDGIMEYWDWEGWNSGILGVGLSFPHSIIAFFHHSKANIPSFHCSTIPTPIRSAGLRWGRGGWLYARDRSRKKCRLRLRIQRQG